MTDDDAPIRWWQFRRRSRCPHVHVRGIYGDEIIFGTPHFHRIQCLDCWKFLDGPVQIAKDRIALSQDSERRK